MKHALLLVDPDIRLNQQVALGLSEELQKHEAWTVHVQSPYRLARGVFRPGRHDAVVVRGPWPDLARTLEKLSVPLVVVADQGAADRHTPAVIVDDDAVGAMAAEYLLGQQFEHVAAVAHDGSFTRPRIQVFFRLIERRGKRIGAFRLPYDEEGDHPFSGHGKRDELVQWLRCLPKPCAVFAHSDQVGAYLIDACIRNDIRVPEEVSVLGGDTEVRRMAPSRHPAGRPGMASACRGRRGPARVSKTDLCVSIK